MLLKSADDRGADLRALEALRAQPGLDPRARRAIDEELWSIRLGAKAEADAAYQLDFDLRDSKHWAVIHDLRIDLDGRVAQIDHLVISRLLEVFVCESKSYTGGVKVNDRGEWSTYRDRRPVGIPSPVEQNRRHIAVLEDLVKRGRVKLPRRIVTLRPTFKNIVLVSAGGLITRPRKRLPELDSVVKVDQFRTFLLDRAISDRQILKLVGSDTLEAFGRQLVALHRPANFDWAARFGISTATAVSAQATKPTRGSWLVKYDGTCSNCGTKLAKGTEAIWLQRERRMLCLDCGAVQ
jgi:Nuclease-related domain